MKLDNIKQIIESALDDNAPFDALFQARDIFETIFTATQKNDAIPVVCISSPEERAEVLMILATNGVHDEISFKTLLGCIDKLLNSSAGDTVFQARYLFGILLKSL